MEVGAAAAAEEEEEEEEEEEAEAEAEPARPAAAASTSSPALPTPLAQAALRTATYLDLDVYVAYVRLLIRYSASLQVRANPRELRERAGKQGGARGDRGGDGLPAKTSRHLCAPADSPGRPATPPQLNGLHSCLQP